MGLKPSLINISSVIIIEQYIKVLPLPPDTYKWVLKNNNKKTRDLCWSFLLNFRYFTCCDGKNSSNLTKAVLVTS